MALEPPVDLTIPREGSVTARGVLSLALRRVLGELYTLPRIAPADPDEAPDVAAFGRVLTTLGANRSGAGAVASLVRQPTVGTLVRCLRGAGAPDVDQAAGVARFRELRAQVAFELARTGNLPEPLRVVRPSRSILSQGAGVALDLPVGSQALTFVPGRLTVTLPDGSYRAYDLAALDRGDTPEGISWPYHPIAGEVLLALRDNNPLAMFEAHPDKQGNAIDLGGHPVEAWLTSLRACLALVAEYLPALRAEMDLVLRQVVPVGYDTQKHLSASYQEDIGTIYLTLHPSLMTMTEAVIHEYSHNKLNALFELDPVLENAFWPLYKSPVRPDPRPLHGVLLAVHAFQPVARLYEAMVAAGLPQAQRPDFLQRFAQVRKVNREGAETVLTHGRPTPIGRGLLDEIRHWDEHFAEV